MSLGELPPSSNYRGYYKCENLNDSSGNGFNLTNVGSVTFVAGRFSNAATMGVSNAVKGLGTGTTNILTGLKVANCTLSYWLKFNTTANTAIRSISQVATTGDSTGCLFGFNYDITSGVMSIQAVIALSTTNASVNYSLPSLPTGWLNLILVKRSTVIVDFYLNGFLVGTSTGVGTDISIAAAPTHKFIIGNNRIAQSTGLTFATFDEVIVEERAWSASEITKYYTQAKGRFSTFQ